MDGLVHGVVMDRLGLGGMVNGLILSGMVDSLGPGVLDENRLLNSFFFGTKSMARVVGMLIPLI